MVAIGGIGGSGTRVVAQILMDAGYFMGNDLNASNDNLLFTLLFKRENILISSDQEFNILWRIFLKVMKQNEALDDEEYETLRLLSSKDRELHHQKWLEERLQYLKHNNIESTDLIGFKEPNSHIVIEKLLQTEKNLKYIYVYRNGLDMAYSSNQNQLKLWGNIFFNDKNIEITPENSLKYWCLVHQRILKLQKSYPDRIFMLDFDGLCKEPESIMLKVSEYLKIKVNLKDYTHIIKMPSSIGRYKNFTLQHFDIKDLDYVFKIYREDR